MKRLSYILFTLLIIGSATSCKKNFLEQAPLDRFSDAAVWQDPALVQTFVNNIYLGIPFPFQTIMLSSYVDESMAVWDWESSNVTKSLMTPSYLATWDPNFWTAHQRDMTWDRTYKNIRACNLFFEKIDNVPFDDKLKKDQLKGEVYFLRAYFYHQLVSLYGGVPLITKAFGLNDDFSVPRDTYEACIKFITDECDKAAALLPVSGDKARATKGAALALKARVLLYAASDLYNSNASWAGGANKELVGYVGGDRQARWQAAKAAAKAVIDLNKYSLYKPSPATPEEASKNYADLFLNNGNEEDIFLQFNDNLHNTSWDAPHPGLFNGPNGWHNWGGNTPIGQLADAYEMKDGTPFSWANPQQAADPYKNRDPRFYASILYEGAQWRQRPADVRASDPVGIVQVGFYKKADGTIVPGLDTRKSPIEDWNGGYTGYYLRKFIDPNIDHQYNKQQWPWRRFRYAEVLLNYAEACIALGQEDEARTYINMIRKRAGMPNITDAGQALVNRYRNERRIELAYEEHRFYDVRRWLIAPEVYQDAMGVSVTGNLNPDGSITSRTYSVVTAQTRQWNPRFYFLPIKLDEMNRNKKLVQNPLY
ncbi:MAG: RagB/SusD family nutrient uptake outer membrane protein [Flavisolibacter sp.]|nr:RagB/SusD family nutrient uptake outer membrane protein [Flavisolibacter sp.]